MSFLYFWSVPFSRFNMLQAACAGLIVGDIFKIASSRDSRTSPVFKGVEWLTEKVRTKLLNLPEEEQEDLDATIYCETPPCSMAENCPDLLHFNANLAPTQWESADSLSSVASAFDLDCTQNGTSDASREEEDEHTLDETQFNEEDGEFLVRKRY